MEKLASLNKGIKKRDDEIRRKISHSVSFKSERNDGRKKEGDEGMKGEIRQDQLKKKRKKEVR